MTHLTAAAAQKDFRMLMDRVTRYREPVTVVSDDGQVTVMLSFEDWCSIQETLYLQGIPGMVDAIHAAAEEPLDLGTSAEEVDFGV